MFAPLNGAPLNGGASGLWLRGRLSAGAFSWATPTVTRYLSASTEPVAEVSATPLRITHITGVVEAEAAQTVDATRLAKGRGQAVVSAHSNGDGYELVFMSGRSATTASTNLTAPWALRPMGGSADAEANTTGNGVRFVYMTPVAAESVAESSGVSERVTPAPDTHPASALAGSAASANRTAWMERSTTEATSDFEMFAYRARPMAGQAVAESAVSADYESWWRAPRRVMRTASQTWIAESHVEKLRIRQRFSTAYTVAQSRSSALANTKIGRGTMRPESYSGHVAGTLRLYRDHRGVAYSSASSMSIPSRITIIKGAAIATAECTLSPSVTRGGTTYHYGHGTAAAVSEHRSIGLRITEAVGQSAAFSESAGKSYQIRAFTGTAEAQCDEWSIDRARVNPWVRATGQSVAESDQSAYIIRQDFVTAKELVNSAKSTGWCYREVPTWDSTTVTASISADVTRLAKVEGYDAAISTMDINTTVYSWRYPDFEPLIVTSGGRDLANKIAHYVDEVAEPGSEIHCDATRLAIPRFEAQPNEAVTQGGEPLIDRYVEADSTATAQSDGTIQPYRFITAPGLFTSARCQASAIKIAHYVDEAALGSSVSTSSFDINAYVRTALPKALTPLADTQAEGLRITFIDPAHIAESWAETGRVSFKINPGAPAPDRRTITLMPGARVMSVPATSREYII